jgi:hypothetical protein
MRLAPNWARDEECRGHPSHPKVGWLTFPLMAPNWRRNGKVPSSDGRLTPEESSSSSSWLDAFFQGEREEKMSRGIAKFF